MSIQMSEAEARRAGLIKGKASTRSTAGSGRGSARSRCHCGEEFTSDAKETKHMNDTGHHRYETVLE